MTFIKVAKTVDVPSDKMKHVEVEGKEIMIANVGGKFYAIGDRCAHMNVRLSMGTLTNTVVTCPAHFSRFDVITGKLISEPKMMDIGTANMFTKCPEEVQKAMAQMTQRMGEIMGVIKTYDMPVFEAKVDGDDLLINI
jgi:nitrite reductase/ring-hydroxylating ferredoxin subunit